ncbi:MAG: hypothetical protein RLZZ502_1907 [Pseudomonadota bacterium]|jgi:uncharacterized protein (TIGR00369 family)
MQYDPDHQFFDVHVPFLSSLGVHALKMNAEEDSALISIDLHRGLENSISALHGGAIASLLDVAMAAAARARDRSVRVTTIEMHIHYMRPAQAPVVYATGKLTHGTGSMAFTEAICHNEAGEVFARATGTFKKLKPKV